jgi:ABC-type multidrug transport system fused ATPase/permease subunit
MAEVETNSLKEPLFEMRRKGTDDPPDLRPKLSEETNQAESSDDSEENEIDPPLEKAKKPSPSKSLLGSLKDYLWTKWERTFFLKYDRYFTENYVKECNNMHKLAEEFYVENQIKVFEDTWRTTVEEKVDKSVEDKQGVLDDLSKSVDRPVALLKIFFWAGWPYSRWAILFRVLRQTTNILIPYVMSEYLKKIKDFKQVTVLNSILICLLAAVMAFWRDLWAQLSIRWTSQTKARCLEMLRDNMFLKLLDSNIEFLTQAETAFLSKLLLYETQPIETFISGFIAMFAAPITITVAVTLIIREFKSNNYEFLIFGFLTFLVVVIYGLHQITIQQKKRFRTLGSKCTGEVEEIATEPRFVQGNCLQKHILRQVWKFRRGQMTLLRKIHYLEAGFSFLFSSPVIAGSLLVIAVQRFDGPGSDSLDPVTLFTIISAVGSLRAILVSLSDALSSYQDFRPAFQLFDMFFNKVSRTPKITVLEHVYESKQNKSGEKLRIQYPKTIVKEDALQLATEITKDKENAQIVFHKCDFLDRSKQVKQFLEIISKDKHLELRPKINIDQEEVFLKKISLTIQKNQKICIMGEEGSGHQTFLDCLSNEHDLENGLLVIRGTVAHFDSHRFSLLDMPFIENIILDRKLVRKRLDKICAALELSLDRFVGGERGTLKENPNMTDMQKLKILLARSLYSQFGVFVISNLFDSLALDEKVDLFDKTVRGYLSLGTVIFESNDKTLAERADWVIIFEGGKIIEQGTPKTLAALRRRSAYAKLTQIQKLSKSSLNITKSKLVERRARRRNALVSAPQLEITKIKGLRERKTALDLITVASTIILFKRLVTRIMKKRMERLSKNSSLVMLSESMPTSLFKFLRLKLRYTPVLLIFLFFLSALLTLAFDAWLGWWTINSTVAANQVFYFEILIVISVVTGFYTYARDVAYHTLIRHITNGIFYNLVNKIVRADITWFENLTVPKILYNMTYYQAMLDEDFNRNVFKLLNSSSLGLVAIVIANLCFPMFIVVTIFIVWYLGDKLSRITRALRITLPQTFAARIEWFGAFQASLNHSVSMRFINRPRYLFPMLEKAAVVVEVTRSMYGSSTGRWLGLRTSFMSAVLIFSIYICPVIIVHTKVMDYSSRLWILSIALLWAGRLTEYLGEFAGTIVPLIVACEGGERLCNLSIEEEASEFHQNKTKKAGSLEEPAKNYRSSFVEEPLEVASVENGIILEMKHVSFKEKNQTLLEDINFTVEKGQKIALIQEKGHSIRSLFDLLLGFRTVPAVTRNGTEGWKFTLYGQPIETLTSQYIQQHQTYLLAKAPLVTGTLRDNVDPMRLFKEDDIIRILYLLGFDKALKEQKQEILGLDFHNTGHFQATKSVLSEVLAQQKHASKENVRKYDKCKKFKKIARRILMDIKWKKAAQKDQQKLREENKLSRDLVRFGVSRLSIISSLSLTRSHAESDISNHLAAIPAESKTVIEKAMDVEVDKENTTTFLKRIVALARAILIRPEIIIAEEDSFVTSNDFGQVSRVLDTCLPILAKSTILCKITSFNLLDRFTKCAIFDDKTVTRFCTTQDLLSDVNSDTDEQYEDDNFSSFKVSPYFQRR